MIFDPANAEALERIRRENAEYVALNSQREAERIAKSWRRKSAQTDDGASPRSA